MQWGQQSPDLVTVFIVDTDKREGHGFSFTSGPVPNTTLTNEVRLASTSFYLPGWENR